MIRLAESRGARCVLLDHQGSTRAVMNNSQIVERHDFKPFGEELGAGTGLRTTGQGYSVQNPLRQQYALTERDSPTGLDHAWFRKSDSGAGRWTSPDPYDGSLSIGDPQSLNSYAYVENDPVNAIDPTGLCTFQVWYECTKEEGRPEKCHITNVIWDCSQDAEGSSSSGSHGGGGGGGPLIQPIIDGNFDIDWTGRGPRISPISDTSYWARFWKCMNEFRLDNVIRYVGQSTGHPAVGEFAASLTVISTVSAIANTALNFTSLGSYPRGGLGGVGQANPVGSPTTWEHTVGGAVSRSSGMPWIGRAARWSGRAANVASQSLIVFEAGYEAGNAAACAVIARQ